jgi:hypothetical protein
MANILIASKVGIGRKDMPGDVHLIWSGRPYDDVPILLNPQSALSSREPNLGDATDGPTICDPEYFDLDGTAKPIASHRSLRIIELTGRLLIKIDRDALLAAIT